MIVKKLSLFLLAASAPFAAVWAQPESGAPATAEQTVEQPAQAEQQQQRKEQPAQRRICRRIDTTGSRTGGQRVCMTAEEWRRVEY